MRFPGKYREPLRDCISEGVRGMSRRKKAVIITASVIAAFILFFPFGALLKDGGTVIWQPVSRIYRVDKLHELNGKGGFTVGTVIYILGEKVYNNTWDIDSR